MKRIYTKSNNGLPCKVQKLLLNFQIFLWALNTSVSFKDEFESILISETITISKSIFSNFAEMHRNKNIWTSVEYFDQQMGAVHFIHAVKYAFHIFSILFLFSFLKKNDLFYSHHPILLSLKNTGGLCNHGWVETCDLGCRF